MTEGRIIGQGQAIGGNEVRPEAKTNSRVEEMKRNLDEDCGRSLQMAVVVNARRRF